MRRGIVRVTSPGAAGHAGRRRTRATARIAALACALLGVGVVAGAHASAAESAREQVFESANAAFADGRFDDARGALAELARNDGASPAVLYNLGNAAFRAGKPGEAILAYERALWLAPRDQDVRANLRQVRKAAGLPEPDDGPWLRLARAATANGWAWLASAGLYVACLSLLLRRLASGDARGRPRRGVLSVSAGVGLALLLLAGAACATRLGERDRGVVLDGDPKLRVAPYASATVSSELAPGEIVRIERGHEGFTLVRTVTGRSGWMTGDAVGRIAPD
ncbi:tetratricopeptide repeat protein [Candidatus Binatia bacterium]|nr:tetratricopeptide repeat protein [Candidatus Binatia bacterium]